MIFFKVVRKYYHSLRMANSKAFSVQMIYLDKLHNKLQKILTAFIQTPAQEISM